MEEKKVFGCPEDGVMVKANLCWSCYCKARDTAIKRKEFNPTNLEDTNRFWGYE